MDRSSSAGPPDWPRRWLSPARRALAVQFARFAMVGTVGLAVDIAAVTATRGSLGLLVAGLVGFALAINVNFVLNRAWTFPGADALSAGQQWRRYLVANAGGFVVNRGVYAMLIWIWPLTRVYPSIAILCGVIAGMFLNFSLSRAMVFR